MVSYDPTIYVDEFVAVRYTGKEYLSQMDTIIVGDELFYRKECLCFFPTNDRIAYDYLDYNPEFVQMGITHWFLHESEFCFKRKIGKKYVSLYIKDKKIRAYNLKLGLYIRDGPPFIGTDCNECDKCIECVTTLYPDTRMIPIKLFKVITGLDYNTIQNMRQDGRIIAPMLNQTLYMNFAHDSRVVSDKSITININGIPHHTRGKLIEQGYSDAEVSYLLESHKLDCKRIYGYKFYRHVKEGDYVTLRSLAVISGYMFEVLLYFKRKGYLKTKRVTINKHQVKLYNTKINDNIFLDAGFKSKQWYLDNGMDFRSFNKLHMFMNQDVNEDGEKVYSLRVSNFLKTYDKTTFMKRFNLTPKEFDKYRILGMINIRDSRVVGRHRQYYLTPKNQIKAPFPVLSVDEFKNFYNISYDTLYRWRNRGGLTCSKGLPPNIQIKIRLPDHLDEVCRDGKKYYSYDYFIKKYDITPGAFKRFSKKCGTIIEKVHGKRNGVKFYSEIEFEKELLVKDGYKYYSRDDLSNIVGVKKRILNEYIFYNVITRIVHDGYYLYTMIGNENFKV
jgi:hypothetical protein